MDNLTGSKGNWNEIKGKLKQKFGLLNDSDLLFVKGRQDEMPGRLQIKPGRSKAEVHKIISEL
jgi:uncharacterized protein YjbJ (UPF0337 family)